MLLQQYKIGLLADVRRFPGSRRLPHFSSEHLRNILAGEGIQYLHMESLGGRRKASRDSHNTSWRNLNFRGYADYMETDEFRSAVSELENLALSNTVAYMCSELLWWRCHRALLSDFLKSRGWEVIHIFDQKKTEPHRYSAPAFVSSAVLSYSPKESSGIIEFPEDN